MARASGTASRDAITARRSSGERHALRSAAAAVWVTAQPTASPNRSARKPIEPSKSAAGKALKTGRCQQCGLKSLELRERIDRFALRAPAVDRRFIVRVAERDAAKQDVFGREIEEGD